MVKIYTKTGDKGQTSLLGGRRVSKSDLRIEVIGIIDELNSALGVALAQIRNSNLEIRNELLKIQNDLFGIGSLLATPSTKPLTLNPIPLKKRVGEFEVLIDKLTEKLPEIRNFILPGGGESGSFLHFARAVCRRAERKIVKLSQKEKIDKSVVIYFNRLSDLLFTMARFVNFKEKQKEIVWTPRR